MHLLLRYLCSSANVNATRGGVAVDNQYGMTTVDLNNTGYKEEPFVLAKDVNQVFYIKDMSTKPKREKNNNDTINEPKRHIVLSGRRNIIGIEDKSDISEDYEKDDRIPPFGTESDQQVNIL